MKRLKQSYYKFKGNIFDMNKRYTISRNKEINSVHKTCQESIIEILEAKPLVFNLKTDYLTNKNDQELLYEEMSEKVRLIEKERYLKYLKMSI